MITSEIRNGEQRIVVYRKAVSYPLDQDLENIACANAGDCFETQQELRDFYSEAQFQPSRIFETVIFLN